MLDNGVSLGRSLEDGQNLIHTIALRDSRVEYLRLFPADYNAKDIDGDSVLHYLSKNPKRNFEFLKFLLEHGADVHAINNKNESVIYSFINNLYVTAEEIKLLLEHGAKVDFEIPEDLVFLTDYGTSIKSVVDEIELDIISDISEATGLPDTIVSLINRVISPFSPFKI